MFLIIRPTYAKTFIARVKQTVNASQDRYNIQSCWNNLFQDKQIICLRQADSASRFYGKEYNFDKSLPKIA